MKIYYGTKQQTTQAWDKNGKRLAVTVIKTEPLVVTQVKNSEKDGYQALQVGFGQKSAKNVSKPVKQHLKADAKTKTIPRFLREIPVIEDKKLKDTVTIDQVFELGDIVNATSTMKGRGFTGAMKRWGFGGGPKTHGQSDRARAVGSIGQGTDPGRVHKGKKMPGHHGDETRTIKNLQVIHVDNQNQELWLAGLVPGPVGTVVSLKYIRSKKFAGLDEASSNVKPVSEKKTEATQVVEDKPEEIKESANTNQPTQKIEKVTKE